MKKKGEGGVMKEEKTKGNPSTYRNKIIELLINQNTPMTDRAIMRKLGVIDPNNIRPEITRLKAKGVIFEVDRVKCEVTNKMVRRTSCTVVEGNGQLRFV